MSESRAKNTKRNIIFSFFDTFLTMGFQFVSRTVIVYIFSDQYLGLSSLFSSILQVLNMADLGFSIAIIYNMYKPIAEHDDDTVCALLNYYKNIYRIIGIVILGAGILAIPIIPLVIKGDYPTDINIYIIYLLYLANTVISYFLFAYKSALLNALQRLDLTKISYSLVNILQYIFQLLSLLVLNDFYLFIICMVIGTAMKNIICDIISKNKFSQYECRGILSEDIRKDIITRLKGILISNISGVTYTTFDSIILSAFVGLTTVAIYNNYIVIFNGLVNFFVLIRNAMQASVGNSITIENKEKNYEDMLIWQFLFSCIASWCVTCMLSIYQPFMTIWMGKKMLLPMIDVIMICILFFFSVVSHAHYLYMSGSGMWWEMRWPYILSTICNLILNIILGKLFGVTGIIFATVIASILFGMIWQCNIIFRIYFEKSSRKYFGKQSIYFFVCIISSILSLLINNLITIEGMSNIIVRIIVCTIVYCGIAFLFFYKTKEFRQGKRIILYMVKR